MLSLHNRSLNVEQKHIDTTERSGGWHITFMVGVNTTVKFLGEAGWTLYYKLLTLAMRRTPTWSRAVRLGFFAANVSKSSGNS